MHDIGEYWDISKGRFLTYIPLNSTIPYAHGFYGEVVRCTVFRKGQLQEIAVKHLRPGVQMIKNGKALSKIEADARCEKRLRREMDLWSTLKHRHIAPLLGYTLGSDDRCLVSKFYINGAIAMYATGRNNKSRLELLTQTADGLAYLHKKKIVHHDIKSANVMIDDKAKAVIIDFGASYNEDQAPNICTSSNLSQSALWTPPERIWHREYGNNERIPQYSYDIWAFGCLILEVFSNAEYPWKRYENPATVWSATRPERRELPGEPKEYPGVPAGIWDLCKSCWNYDRDQRPTISGVCDMLKKANQTISA
ncbi:hypothetical protein FRC02_011028 [Tulasnella sp. 418]|nr:hypothetical protein FRC02_011028 [Tulasnella sp. 418]